MASASGGSPCLAQRWPANQGALEREERLVDVGPLVVTGAQASELVEPRKRPFHDPPPATKPPPVRSTTHSDPTMDREAAPQPYPFTLLRWRGSGFGGFVTCSYAFQSEVRSLTD